MRAVEHVWAIVLAGGDGARVRPFFKDPCGRPVPKQFCPIDGHQPLVRWAIDRATRLVSIDHVVMALTERHREWWEPVLSDIEARNLIVQPSNRGTAAGLLLPLLDILRRDSQAKVVVFPSDHYVADEPRLSQAVVEALAEIQHDPEHVTLLGIVPEDADPEYGWILPERRSGSIERVASFVEKPDRTKAGSLRSKGGLLNSLILVGAGRTLLHLYTLGAPELVDKCVSWQDRRSGDDSSIESFYESLPCFDFSRQVLERCTEHLAVARVPECGWTDLGTPERLQHFRESHLPAALAI